MLRPLPQERSPATQTKRGPSGHTAGASYIPTLFYSCLTILTTWRVEWRLYTAHISLCYTELNYYEKKVVIGSTGML